MQTPPCFPASQDLTVLHQNRFQKDHQWVFQDIANFEDEDHMNYVGEFTFRVNETCLSNDVVAPVRIITLFSTAKNLPCLKQAN